MTNRSRQQMVSQDHQASEHTETSESQMCPECTSSTVVPDAGVSEFVCNECGLVIEEDIIDQGPEWRAFTQDERNSRSRVGAPTTNTLHDKGLTTQIDWKNQDGYGNIISGKKRKQMNRLRTWQERIRTQNAGERNLKFALGELDRMASALGLPQSTREVGGVLYRQVLERNLIIGRSIEGVATSCLYAACRQEGIPRSLDEVTEVSRVPYQKVSRTYLQIMRDLNLEMPPVDPKEFVPRFSSELQVSEEVRQVANEIIDTTAEQGLLSGKSPAGYAAAALYSAGILCNEKRTQEVISEVANVSKVTIRCRYQEQLEAIKSQEMNPIRKSRLREIEL